MVDDFRRALVAKFSAGNTFTEGEIQVLEFIVQTMLRGGTPQMATRHKDFAGLCRKVIAMKASVARKRAEAGGVAASGGLSGGRGGPSEG